MDNKTERKVPGFGKIMLASGVGTLIVLVLIGLFKLLVFFGILGSIGSDSGVVVAKDSFLKIDLTQPVNERTPSELEGLMGKSETAYSIGKTDTTSSNGFLVLDNHSTFTLDGRDIWKQLHKNGIRIETGMDGLKWVYTIYQNETKIARVVSANKKVHEEEEDGVLSKVPMQGFFRIWTRELSLDAVFMTVFAIGRTDMMLYD